ncbi:hypothetical protein BH09PSE3_BH09PSE3_15610 [soil metagenome]
MTKMIAAFVKHGISTRIERGEVPSRIVLDFTGA